MNKDDSEEVLGDVLSLCAKILHDAELEDGQVYIGDLIELRDGITEVRKRISTAGFKSFSRIREEP